jgi:hypothetical protein
MLMENCLIRLDCKLCYKYILYFLIEICNNSNIVFIRYKVI